MAALNHPNIVTVFDVGAHRRRPYVVSELLEGQTLRSRLGRGPLPTKTAVRWAHEFSQGLAAAHEKGIIHRDLKPENLFITRNGHLKILDFGLAKLMKVGAAAAITTAARDSQPGTIVGTVGYMSPEQIIGQPVDQRSDIFCFGVILYEMLTGRSPFQRENAIETMRAIVKDQPPSLSIEGDALLTVLDRIVQRCLEKDPDRRFQAAQHILDFRGAQLILAIDLQSERATEHRPAESQVDDDEERDHIHHWIVPFVLSLAISLLAALPFLLFFLFDRIWLEHSPSVRFATLLLAVAALHLIGSAIGRAVPFAGSTFHAVGTIAFGGAIFLTAQTFNLDQRWSIGMLLWVIGAWAAWRLVDDDAQVYLVALLTPAWLVSEWLVMTESASVAGQPLLSAGLTLLAFAYFTAPQSTRLFARGHVLRVIGGLAILPAISSVWIAGRSPVAARSGDLEPLSFESALLGWAVALGVPLVLATLLRKRGAWVNAVAAVWIVVAIQGPRLSFGIQSHRFGILEWVFYTWFVLGAGAIMMLGVRESRNSLINVGAVVLAASMLGLYISQVGRSEPMVVFAGLAILLIVGGWLLERTRLRLLSKAGREL